jgi:hypothetical protein
MKAQHPALTKEALASAAGRKAEKVQRKLQEAEAELHTANELLVEAVPKHDQQEIEDALKQNVAAEEKVHEAAEELEVVKELLAEAGPATAPAGPARTGGQSGRGVKSLIPHLTRSTRTA